MPDHGDNLLASPSGRHRPFGGGDGSYRHRADRADGLSGPTLRYAFIVSVLVVMTSLPVLAAISAGSSTINGSALPDRATPFIPQPSDGPVIVPLPPSALPPTITRRVGDPVAVMTPPRRRTPAGAPPPWGPAPALPVTGAPDETGGGARSDERGERPPLRTRPPRRPAESSYFDLWRRCASDPRRCPVTMPPCPRHVSGSPRPSAAPWSPSRSAGSRTAVGRPQQHRSHRVRPAHAHRTGPARATVHEPYVKARSHHTANKPQYQAKPRYHKRDKRYSAAKRKPYHRPSTYQRHRR